MNPSPAAREPEPGLFDLLPSGTPTELDQGRTADYIAACTGVAVIIGERNSGRARLALEAVRRAGAAQVRAAFLDIDPEGGVVGPPGVIAIAGAEQVQPHVPRLPAHCLGFVGETRPPGHFLAILVETLRLIRRRSAHYDLIVIRTPAFTRGRLAAKLIVNIVTALEPCMAVHCRRGDSDQHFSRQLAALLGCPVVTCLTRSAFQMPAAQRRLKAAAAMMEYLKDAQQLEFVHGQVYTSETWAFQGAPLTPQALRQAAGFLKREVSHGERMVEGFWLCTDFSPEQRRLQALSQEWGSPIWSSRIDNFRDLLCGLYEPGGMLASIGLLREIDFVRERLIVSTRLHSARGITTIRFGRLCINSDGSIRSHLRVADV